MARDENEGESSEARLYRDLQTSVRNLVFIVGTEEKPWRILAG